MKALIITLLCNLFALNVFCQKTNDSIELIAGTGIIFGYDGPENIIEIEYDTSYSLTFQIVDCTPSRANYFMPGSGIVSGSFSQFQKIIIPEGVQLRIVNDHTQQIHIDTAYLLSQGWKLPEPKVIKMNKSGSGTWGTRMLMPSLIFNLFDTIPVVDSVVYEKIGGDFYKREYTSEYAIFYTMPEDSTSLDADSVGFDLILDSLYREFDVADRRIDRLRNRIELERENKRELRNQILDATIRQRELLKIRRRYYKKLN